MVRLECEQLFEIRSPAKAMACSVIGAFGGMRSNMSLLRFLSFETRE